MLKGGDNMKAKPDYEPKDAAKDKKLGIKENSRKDEKQDAKGMKKKPTAKKKKDAIDKGMTPKSEARDATMDKKRGIRENSKRDVNFDSRGMQNLKSAMMGMKRGKR